jgi:hypothetical protein
MSGRACLILIANARPHLSKGLLSLQKLSPVQRKSAATLIWLVVAFLAYSSALGVLLKKTPLGRLDQRAASYVEKTMARAAYTFAMVRGLNGMISVIQGTEVAVSPAGIGLTLTVGEILDPINDLAERFSWVMLVSTTSLGIQRILMEMSDWLGLQVFLAAGTLLLAVSAWRRFWGSVDLQSLGVRLVMLAIVVRLLIPAVALASETIYDRFLNVQYEEATQTLMHVNDELKQVDPTTANDKTAPPTAGKIAEVRRWLAETQKWFDLREKIDNLATKLERFTTDTVRLMVVFILQTIIIPLFTLWALVKLTTIWRVPHHKA